MSWWDNLTKPIDKALDSNAFKAIFPVQALAQGLTQGATKLAHIGGPQGLSPANQYAAGAAGGSAIAGGSALAGMMGGGGGGAASMGPVGPMSQAGSTLGGGMSAPTNLGPSAMGSTGAAPGASVASSPASMLQNMRQMPMGGGQQQQPTQQRKDQLLAMIYAKFPQLRPGAQIGGQNAIR